MSEKVVLGSARYECLVLGVTWVSFFFTWTRGGRVKWQRSRLPFMLCMIEEDAFASVVSFVS